MRTHAGLLIDEANVVVQSRKLRFAWLPVWTNDMGWVCWANYQETRISFYGAHLRMRCAYYLNWWQWNWGSKHSTRYDCAVVIPRGSPHDGEKPDSQQHDPRQAPQGVGY